MAEILSVSRIWGRSVHAAFTDLGRFRGTWFCVFREADGHQGSVGGIRVLRCADGAVWKSVAFLHRRGIDLRDPKIDVSPRGELELLMGGTEMVGGRAVGRQPCLSRSPDGVHWSAPAAVMEPGDWLWRAVWSRGRRWGISYRLLTSTRWAAQLLESRDGRSCTNRVDLDVPGRPNEATLRFRRDGRAVVLVRREAGRGRAWIGTSRPPYRRWRWTETTERVGGPNFLILADGSMWAAARIWSRGAPVVALCRMSERSLLPVLELPSGGDCGYPGMVFHRGLLWMSYYSSHEGGAKIYLAKVRLGDLAKVRLG